MANLENLKKQAKLVLRWHREQYHPVAAQIRTHLPRCRHLTDAEVLKQPFNLSDAQELVARRHGFESWQALKAGIATMPSNAKSIVERATLIAAEPQLFVADIKSSCDFFTGKLGFRIAFIYGEPPYYAQVQRDGARLNLRCVNAPVLDQGLREREELLSAALSVATADELKQLLLEFQAAGVTFHQRLKHQPWGAKNFIVKDPDGNLLLFASPTD